MPSSPCATTHRSATFTLNVTLGYGANNRTEGELNKACSQQQPGFGLSAIAASFFSSSSSPSEEQQHRFFVASASHARLSIHSTEKFWKLTPNLVLVFVPPHVITSACETQFSSSRQIASGSSFWVGPSSAAKFANDLLPKIHPTALFGCTIRGIILTSIAAENGPAEMVLLEVPKGRSIQDDILRPISGGCVIAGDPGGSVLKILPVTSIEFKYQEDDDSSSNTKTTRQAIHDDGDRKKSSTESAPHCTTPQIPACPVCIHRIDPVRLGLPAPSVQYLCSQFCESPSLLVGSWRSQEESCAKQKLLIKWSAPARCKACQVIDHYWNYNNRTDGDDEEDRDLFCAECSMHKTLWTCLTCGYVGCGRYSNKHSVAHFEQTGHPYSLELATLRIWDYCHGEYGGFVQRADLLECPSSPPLLYPWLTRGLDLSDHNNSSFSGPPHLHNSLDNSMYGSSASASLSKSAEKSSKKVAMIGEEYEALLQSALEDQAQHYEDEITRLHAEHANILLDRNSMEPDELREMEALKLDIRITREEIEKVSKELLEAQAQESELRIESQRLLSHQQESNELLKKIQEEHRRENEEGKMQIEDLEQQIADLSANLRMRQQFSQSDELSNAQIFGTTTLPESKPRARKGKKKGRVSRK